SRPPIPGRPPRGVEHRPSGQDRNGRAGRGGHAMKRLPLGLLTALTALSASTAAAQGFDRTKHPVLRPPARLSLPPVHSAQLPNGMKLYVIEMHEVPLVQFSLAFSGGGRLDQQAP